MIEEVRELIQDFTVWLKMKRDLEGMFGCDFRLKEDDDDNLTVIFNEKSYENNEKFKKDVLEVLVNTFGTEIATRTTFRYVDENEFKIII